MKSSVVLLTVLSSMTVPRPARATLPTSWWPEWPTDNPPDNPGYPFDISPQEMGEFKSQKAIKGNANIELQEEGSDGSFQVDGMIVTQSDCTPVNAYVEEGATYSSGGINHGKAPPNPDLCMVTHGEKSVTVVRSRDTGRVEYAVAFDKVNKICSNVVTFKNNILATIKDGDFDTNALKKYELADAIEDRDDRRRRRALGVPTKSPFDDKEVETTTATMMTTTGETVTTAEGPYQEEEDHDATVTGDRSLQTACGPGTKRQIRVAIAYDRSFCDAVGGDAAAVTRINSIVMAANDYYDQTGLCKLVTIAHLDSGCDGSDTFSGAVDRTTLCGSFWWFQSDVLEDFRSLWQSTSSLASVQRSAAHLFFGQGGYTGSTIGCAYLDALCSSQIGYGVNYMTFQGTATPVLLQSLLFTHELGHNAGSEHDSDQGKFIMGPRIDPTVNEFSPSSKNQINSFVNPLSTANSCVPEVSEAGCNGDGDCDDGNDCTADTCNSGQCVYTNDNANSCSDEDDCTVGDTCSSGTCQAGTYSFTVSGCEECTSSDDCDDDGNQCTTTTCVNNECVTTNNSNSCSNGDPCIGGETCSSGTCQGGAFDFNLAGCNPSCQTPGESCGGFFGGSCCAGLGCGSCTFFIFGCSCN